MTAEEALKLSQKKPSAFEQKESNCYYQFEQRVTEAIRNGDGYVTLDLTKKDDADIYIVAGHRIAQDGFFIEKQRNNKVMIWWDPAYFDWLREEAIMRKVMDREQVFLASLRKGIRGRLFGFIPVKITIKF